MKLLCSTIIARSFQTNKSIIIQYFNNKNNITYQPLQPTTNPSHNYVNCTTQYFFIPSVSEKNRIFAASKRNNFYVMESSLTILMHIAIGFYFAIAIVNGIELTFDPLNITKHKPFKPNKPMRIAGAAMLCDSVAIFLNGLFCTITPNSPATQYIVMFFDTGTTTMLTLTGYALSRGGYLRRRTRLVIPTLFLIPYLALFIPTIGMRLYCYLIDIISFGNFIYLAITYRRQQATIHHRYSNLEQHRATWYIYFLAWILLGLPFYHYVVLLRGGSFLPVFIIFPIFYIILRFKITRLTNDDIVDEQQEQLYRNPAPQSETESLFTPEQQKQMEAQLTSLMETEKLYRDPDLKVDDLVRKMNTNTAYFYYFMRDVMHTRFYDMVNGYRIKEAKQHLTSDESIEAIAFECGFNSANAFRRVFKQATGVTPSNWRSANIASK